MKRYKIIISLAAIICGLMIACDNTDYSNKAPFETWSISRKPVTAIQKE